MSITEKELETIRRKNNGADLHNWSYRELEDCLSVGHNVQQCSINESGAAVDWTSVDAINRAFHPSRFRVLPKFRRENRYTVFKNSDVADALEPDEKVELLRLAAKIYLSREGHGKHPLECVIIESDWPEYEPTWAALAMRVGDLK